MRYKLAIAASAIAVISLTVLLFSLAAPHLGLGEREGFILHQYFDITRRGVFNFSLQLAVLAILLFCLIPSVRGWFNRGYQKNVWAADWIRRTSQEPAAFLAVSAIAVVYVNYIVLLKLPVFACFSPDSFNYSSPSVTRTPGYPLLLQAVLMVFDDFRWITAVQLNLMLLSFVMLGFSISRLLGNHLFGLIVALFLILNNSMLLWSQQVLTEAAFISFVTFHLASALLLLEKFSRTRALLTGLFLIGAIIIRPAGYSMILGIPVLVMLIRSQWKDVLLWVGTPVLGLYLLVAGFNHVNYGTFATQSYGGWSLSGHIAHLIKSDMATNYHEITAEIEKRNAPIISDYDTYSYPDEYFVETTNRFNELVYSNVLPAINAHLSSVAPDLSPVEKINRSVDIALSIAIDAIFNSPSGYAKHVLANYYGMWRGSFLYFGNIAPLVKQCFVETSKIIHGHVKELASRVTDTSIYESREIISRLDRSSGDIHFVDVVSSLIMAYGLPAKIFGFTVTLSILLIFLFIKERPPAFMAATYAGFMLHAYFGFVAAIQGGLNRYAVAFEPVLATCVLTGVVVILHCAPAIRRKLIEIFDKFSGRNAKAP
jgi:hypothetical protein